MIPSRLRQATGTARAVAVGRLSRYAGSGVSITDHLEQDLAAHFGVKHALAVSSGTSGLVCALVAAHVGPGDEVLVPAYTWVADAAAVINVGAVPVLVEIDESLTIDPDDMVNKITARTKAVIVVHMVNLVCDLQRVLDIAREHGLFVIEDASQAAGVTYRGRKVGSWGDVGVLSFNQHKNVRAGEGGAVLTNDTHAYERAAMYHDVGNYSRAQRIEDLPPFVGMNFKMAEPTSAILRPQIAGLERLLERRQRARAAIVHEIRAYPGLRISPHHDEASAVGLAVTFDDPADAVRFSKQRGVRLLIDTGRHVFSNWQPVLERRTHDPRINPWSDSVVTYGPDSCPATLEVLARSCLVVFPEHLPIAAVRALAWRLARSARAGSPRTLAPA